MHLDPPPAPAEGPDYLFFLPDAPDDLHADVVADADRKAAGFLRSDAGGTWLRSPTPGAARQAQQWLCCAAQGIRWLQGQDGAAWASSHADAGWYRAALDVSQAPAPVPMSDAPDTDAPAAEGPAPVPAQH